MGGCSSNQATDKSDQQSTQPELITKTSGSNTGAMPEISPSVSPRKKHFHSVLTTSDTTTPPLPELLHRRNPLNSLCKGDDGAGAAKELFSSNGKHLPTTADPLPSLAVETHGPFQALKSSVVNDDCDTVDPIVPSSASKTFTPVEAEGMPSFPPLNHSFLCRHTSLEESGGSTAPSPSPRLKNGRQKVTFDLVYVNHNDMALSSNSSISGSSSSQPPSTTISATSIRLTHFSSTSSLWNANHHPATAAAELSFTEDSVAPFTNVTPVGTPVIVPKHRDNVARSPKIKALRE